MKDFSYSPISILLKILLTIDTINLTGDLHNFKSFFEEKTLICQFFFPDMYLICIFSLITNFIMNLPGMSSNNLKSCACLFGRNRDSLILSREKVYEFLPKAHIYYHIFLDVFVSCILKTPSKLFSILDLKIPSTRK